MVDVAEITALVPVDARAHNIEKWRVMKEQAAILFAAKFLPESLKDVNQIIAVGLMGQDCGLSLSQSVHGLYVIHQRVGMDAQTMLSLIHRSNQVTVTIGKVQMKENQPFSCTVIMQRRGQSANEITYTMEDAKRAGLIGKDNWQKNPANMLRYRAISACARITCPDIINGMYTPEELEEIPAGPTPPQQTRPEDDQFKKPASPENKPETAEPELPKTPQNGKPNGKISADMRAAIEKILTERYGADTAEKRIAILKRQGIADLDTVSPSGAITLLAMLADETPKT